MVLRLDRLEVLVVDCQATASAGAGGHLLEIAWARCRADGPSSAVLVARPTSLLVTRPRGTEVAPRVLGLMGLAPAQLTAGVAPAVAWRRLLEDAHGLVDQVAAGGTGPEPDELFARESPARIPAVVHFARFERPFLQALQRAHGPPGGFALELLCTHEIARRLLPALPRRSLRAVAGYCGHTLSGPRRAGAHVAATAAIWRSLVALLRDDVGIETLVELRRWLRARAQAAPVAPAYPLERTLRLELPDRPGVYRLRGADQRVLYVGKARSVRRRVSSHYHAARRAGDRELELLSQVRAVDAALTATALEAALLEVDEIRDLGPPYNVALRGEQLWYASPCFASARRRWDPQHPRGPYPHPEPIEILALARARLEGSRGPPPRAGVLRWLGLGAWDESSADALAHGWDLFWRRWGRAGPPDAVLASAGARIWESRRAPERGGDQVALLDPPPRHPLFAADRMADSLELAIARATHLTRRARWLCRLSESSVAWARRDSSSQRLLVVSDGRVISRGDLPPGACVPVPPGWQRPLGARAASWDPPTHDRLRVLCTELRRILAEGRTVWLRFGPRRVLAPTALSWQLRWV